MKGKKASKKSRKSPKSGKIAKRAIEASRKNVKLRKKRFARKSARKFARKPAKPKLRSSPRKAAGKKLVSRLRKKAEKALSREKLRKKLEQERVELELSAKREAYKRELECITRVLSHSFARQAIVNLAGENSLEIIKSFESNLSDEDIAKRLKLKISDVRATLNKLHGEGLVSYFRDKNNETGWYSYSWAANGQKIEHWVNNRMEERRLAVTSENNDQYFCPSCGINAVHDFETASNISFKCQLCNRNLEFLDEEKRNDLIFGKKERV